MKRLRIIIIGLSLGLLLTAGALGLAQSLVVQARSAAGGPQTGPGSLPLIDPRYEQSYPMQPIDPSYEQTSPLVPVRPFS